jgi:tRNA threonylcarbamoyladenosine biosynthesis protein TsaE
MSQVITRNFEETIEYGYKIGLLLEGGDTILLAGDLGAGKTTFTKGIGKALGINRVINSPTFTIVKEYHGNLDLYHLDLYRLDGLGNDFDLEEYFTSDGVVVCEWPDNVSEIIPNEYLLIEIFRGEGDSRTIKLTPHGKRYEQLVGDLDE